MSTEQKLAEALARIKLLEAQSAVAIQVTSKEDKDGKTWIGVKGIPGTGWGLSAQSHGWKVFLERFDTVIKPAIAKLI